MSGVALRDYQNEALAKVGEAYERGVTRQLGVAATGLGKTIMFCSLAQQLDCPTLILAHRDELISQAVEKLLVVWPEADIGVIKAERNELNHQVIVASVQSLRKPRLAKMAKNMFNEGLIITDEAHHASATSYQNVYEHFGCGLPGGPLHLGVTATPDRGDGGGLDKTYQEIVFNYDLLWGIQRGYLADLKGLRIQLKDVDFTQARISQGDYAAGDVGQMLENADAPDLIAAAWLEHASDRKTLVFTPTVATAEATAESFIAMGVEAAVVSAKTPLEERRLMLKRFAAGELRVIANCGVLTEGFDDPAVNCIVVARPTKSRALYAQIVGRGSRKHPDKTDCLIMDVCGASDENSLLSVPSLFGIEPKDKEKFDAGEETIGEFIFAQEKERVRRGDMQAKAIDLFQKVIDSPINWTHFTSRSGLKTYAINLGFDKADGSIVIEHLGGEDDDRQWHCYLRWDRGISPQGADIQTFTNGDSYRTLIRGVDLEMAQGVGEDYVRKNGASAITNKNAAWRERPPTEKQLAAAEKWGIKVDPSWTAGDVSSAIDTKAQASKHAKKDRAPRKPPPSWVTRK
jgi:ATP-dependent helicase IRC3